MKRLAILVAAVPGLVVGPVLAATHAVPGTFPTIGAALAAVAPGDTILVAAGTYSPSTNGESYPLAVSTSDVRLLGAGMGATVLDAEGTARVIDYSASGGGRISGFTVTGGAEVDGGGFWVRAGTPEVDHNLVVGNSATNRGAGMFVGAASTPNAAPHVHHNVFWENFDGDTTDTADAHGVIYGQASTGIFEHNLIGRTDGNGLLTQLTAAPSVRHNIFFENGIPGPPPRGRGICWFSSSPPPVFHNLFFANQIAALLWPASGGDFSGAAANDVDSLDGIYGNLDGDPLFVDPDNGDFSLQAASPAIDAGDPSLPFDPDGTIADIGPFYFPQPPVAAGPSRSEPAFLVGSAPNPFRGRTEIRLSLPASGSVRVEVFDVAGRRVRDLYDGSLGAGAHAVAWDGRTDGGRAVPSGVYLVRVRTDSGQQLGRVVHLR